MNYYRYQEVRYSNGLDQYDDPLPGHVLKIELRVYEVLKTTKKGVWIAHYGYGKRFVLNDSRKRFACADKKEALESFKFRKRRQLKILSSQIDDCKEAIYQATKMEENI